VQRLGGRKQKDWWQQSGRFLGNMVPVNHCSLKALSSLSLCSAHAGQGQ